jgi:hypothetical protein
MDILKDLQFNELVGKLVSLSISQYNDGWITDEELGRKIREDYKKAQQKVYGD